MPHNKAKCGKHHNRAYRLRRFFLHHNPSDNQKVFRYSIKAHFSLSESSVPNLRPEWPVLPLPLGRGLALPPAPVAPTFCFVRVSKMKKSHFSCGVFISDTKPTLW